MIYGCNYKNGDLCLVFNTGKNKLRSLQPRSFCSEIAETTSLYLLDFRVSVTSMNEHKAFCVCPSELLYGEFQ